MGEMVTYRCGACGFVSEPVLVGRGRAGVQHAPIACTTCRAVYSVEVATWRDDAIGATPPVGAWKTGDSCPRGHAGARLLESTAGVSAHRCPACARPQIRIEPVGPED